MDFAGDYIRMGEIPEERLNLLNTACSAWNCACTPEEQRSDFLARYISEYKRCNPDADAMACAALREDLELLVEQKLKKYPNIIKQIISCDLQFINGQDYITVASLHKE